LATPLRRRLAVLLVPAAAAAMGLASCGGGEGGDEVDAILDRAFSQPIKSANVSLEVEAALDGLERLDSPLRLQLSGPFKSGGGDKLPSVDWKLNLVGGGQTFSARAISTGDNAFFNYQGENYEVGESTIGRLNRELAKSRDGGEDRTLKDLGLTPRDWLRASKKEGDENVAGVETTHVSAGLDIGELLDDLNGVIDRATGELRAQAPPKLTDEQRKKIEAIVEDPSFDVYVGKEDDTLRRLSADLKFNVPEEDRDQVGGLEGGEISFSIEFANVGEEQRIEAPASARPLSDLLSQFGAGGLGGLDGGSSGDSDSGGSSSGGDRTPSADKFERYGQCLNKADPGDLEALQRCSELLK
jgi:hypothetical protein